MISTPTTIDRPFAEYVSLLRRLHRLFTDGKGDSAEADALRDEMDVPWHELTEEERGIVSGLAADLNSIRRGAVSSGKSREELLQENEPALARAYRAGEWYEVLKHLRRLAGVKKPAEVSYLRGRAWSKLLDDETALLFFQHAFVLEPKNGTIAYAAMHVSRELIFPRRCGGPTKYWRTRTTRARRLSSWRPLSVFAPCQRCQAPTPVLLWKTSFGCFVLHFDKCKSRARNPNIRRCLPWLSW